MSNEDIMLGVPVGDTCDENIEFNLYEDAKKGAYGYLGLYKNKRICAVGKVIKVVKVMKINGELEFTPSVTEDERERFLVYKKRCGNGDCPVAEPFTRVFFVDKFYRTNYVNVGTMGIVGGKKFLLHKLLPATTEEIAAYLDGQTWRLVKGEEIIPPRPPEFLF